RALAVVGFGTQRRGSEYAKGVEIGVKGAQKAVTTPVSDKTLHMLVEVSGLGLIERSELGRRFAERMAFSESSEKCVDLRHDDRDGHTYLLRGLRSVRLP